MHGIIVNKTYTKKESEKDKLRLGGGCWTINLAEISGYEIEKIEYLTSDKLYSISFNDAMKKGWVRNFQGEMKLIVPIRYWEVKKGE